MAILLIPVWWFLGIRFFIFHLTALLITIKLFSQKRKNSQKILFPSELYMLSGFILIYILSLLINSPHIPIWRFFASLNNLSFWVMGILLIFTVYNSTSKEDIEKLLKPLRNFALITSAFVLPVFTYAIIANKYISIPSLLKNLLPKNLLQLINIQAPLLYTHISLTIIGKSRLFHINPIQRAKGFNLWGTTFSGTMCLLIAMTLAYYWNKKKKKELAFILSLEFFAIFTAISRNFIWLFLSLAVVLLIVYLKKSLLLKLGPYVLIFLFLFFLLIPLNQVKNTLINVRKQSFQWRLELYKITFNGAIEKPILGHGYKPHPQKYPTTIASHSTYLGVLYKTGFVGLFFFLLFWIAVLRKWWSQKILFKENKSGYPLWFFSGVAFIYGLLWMIGEDLDVPPILAFIYFLIVGITLSLSKLQESTSQKK